MREVASQAGSATSPWRRICKDMRQILIKKYVIEVSHVHPAPFCTLPHKEELPVLFAEMGFSLRKQSGDNPL